MGTARWFGYAVVLVVFITSIFTFPRSAAADTPVSGSERDPEHGVDRCGWYDTEYCYLEPSAAYNRVARWLREEGRSWGLDEAALRRALLDQGYAERPEGDDGKHLANRLSMNGRRHRVMKIPLDRIPFEDYFKQRLV